MAKKFLTDNEVEQEIARLKNSPHVKLARKKAQIEYKRRQALYQLRNLEKKGKELEQAGITMEILEQIDSIEELEDFKI